MSTKAKATLALTTVFTIATVYGAMRAGIARDEERIAKKKQQENNVLDLAVQRELERRMLQEQTLRPSEEDSQ
ncbi:hypothetical protein BGZ73_004902 [Actinomortierella ambigua]|nr:hypothetical protein BGZ73_004902 [Actinomortierella ambigua]